MMVDDGRTYTTSVSMATAVAVTTHQLQLPDGRLYIGGVPDGVDLRRAQTPVHSSLVGAFTNLTINDRCV